MLYSQDQDQTRDQARDQDQSRDRDRDRGQVQGQGQGPGTFCNGKRTDTVSCEQTTANVIRRDQATGTGAQDGTATATAVNVL